MPLVSEVHVSRPDLAVRAQMRIQMPNAFAHPVVFPMVQVAKQTDSYFVFNTGDLLRATAQKRAPLTESAGDAYRLTTATYFAEEWALHHDIADQVRRNTDSPLDPDKNATDIITKKILLTMESEWASKYFVTGVWGTTVTPSPLWSAANSTPVEDVSTGILTMLAATGYRPNVLVLGFQVYNVLRNHPGIVDRVKYGQTPGTPAIPKSSDLAALFDVDRVVVTEAVINSAAQGAADSVGFVAGKHALLAYAPTSGNVELPSAGYTFVWNGIVPGGGMVGVETFRMQNIKADRVEGTTAFDQKLVSADLGYFFLSAVA
jgi:hypothetical protein